MREELRITITGVSGARHFVIDRKRRRQLLAAAIGLSVLLLALLINTGVSAYRLSALQEQSVMLQQAQSDLQIEKQSLLIAQFQLHKAVSSKSRKIADLSANIDSIETLMGLAPEPGVNLQQRVNLALNAAGEKRGMLQSIPSGYPLLDTRVTSRYGNRVHPVRNEKAFHWGVDLKASRGTPIYATAEGVIESAGREWSSGLGNAIHIAHNYGFKTVYGHLDKINVEKGAYVNAGDLIGYSGATGVVDGAHLHYEVRYLDQRINPSPFLDWSWDNYSKLFVHEEKVQWESLVNMRRQTVSKQELPSSQPAPSLSATSP